MYETVLILYGLWVCVTDSAFSVFRKHFDYMFQELRIKSSSSVWIRSIGMYYVFRTFEEYLEVISNIGFSAVISSRVHVKIL